MSSGLLRFEWWESLARAAGRAGRWTVETAHRRSIRSPTRTDGPLSLSVGIAAVGELSLVVRACRISQRLPVHKRMEDPGLEVSRRLENRHGWESGSSRNKRMSCS